MNAADMLGNSTGNGQCTAWADLLVQTLVAQGVTATTQNILSNFTVRPMPAQGSGGADYLVGTSAPGNAFGFHRIVRIGVYPDRIYDPSYGGMVEATAIDSAEVVYEDTNIVKVQKSGIWVNQTLGVRDLLFI